MIKFATTITNILEKSEFKTMSCGGFVRDYIMNRQPHDIDLATQAPPQEVMDILGQLNIQVIPTGIKHGTVTAITDNKAVEITTLRSDDICDGRHATISFTKSFQEDSNRRDFTCNALYMDLNSKDILDFHNGLQDIKNKNLKFVNHASDRIKEDYLRILRACRFSMQLGFNISDNDDLQALFDNIVFIPKFVSSERIKMELDKIFELNNFRAKDHLFEHIICILFKAVNDTSNITQNIPKYHQFDVFGHTMQVIQNSPNKKLIRWAALFHDIGKPLCKTTDDLGIDHFYGHEQISTELTKPILTNLLKMSNHEVNIIIWLIKNHMKIGGTPTKRVVRKLMSEAILELGDKQYFYDLVELKKADMLGGSTQSIQNVDKFITDINNIDATDVITQPRLDINGFEIMKILNIQKPSKEVGKVIKYLNELVIEGSILNNNNSLKEELIINGYNTKIKR